MNAYQTARFTKFSFSIFLCFWFFLTLCVGLWFGVTVCWLFTVHWLGTDTFVTFGRCQQWHSVEFAASIFLLRCTWFGRGWIIGDICIIHWMVGDVLEKLLRAKHCRWQIINHCVCSCSFCLALHACYIIFRCSCAVFFSCALIAADWIYILFNGNRLATMRWTEFGWIVDGESVAIKLRCAGQRAGTLT